MSTDFFSRLAEALGWTLVHSLWQFTVIAVFFGLAIRVLRHHSPQSRYIAGCASMLLMVTAVLVTYATVESRDHTAYIEVSNHAIDGGTVFPSLQSDQGATHREGSTRPDEETDQATEFTDDAPQTAFLVDFAAVAAEQPEPPSVAPGQGSSVDTFRRAVRGLVEPWVIHLASLWLIGIVVVAVRPVMGWRGARRLRRSGSIPVTREVRELATELCVQIGVRRFVSIVESTLVDVPTVIGEVRPLVLLPASAVTGLSITQLEAVIAHELAHVRRHDYLFNALQTVAETFFFYHPALWWVSHQMRIDREDCCDDIALQVTGDRTAYAKMLVKLETMRRESEPAILVADHAMSAGGGSLLSRVQRILQKPTPRHGSGSFVLGSLLMLAAAITVVSLALPTPRYAIAQDGEDLPPAEETVTEPDEPGKTQAPLEMRILVNPEGTEREPFITGEDLVIYRRRLEEGVSDAGEGQADLPYGWFPLGERVTKQADQTYPIEVEWQGKRFVLACNDPGHKVSWKDLDQHLSAATVHATEDGTPQIDVEFDQVLTAKVAKLTSENQNNRLAILIDGKIVSAPRIQALIHRKARITGDFTSKEAEQLRTALESAAEPDRDAGDHVDRVSSIEAPSPGQGDSFKPIENRSAATRPQKENVRLAAGNTPAIRASINDLWYRPTPAVETDRDLRFGKGRWFVQIAASRSAQDDLGIDDGQRQKIEDIEKLYRRGGPDGLSPTTSKERQQLWMAAREAAESLLTKQQIRRVDQWMIQLAGTDAFRDAAIVTALEMTDEQQIAINSATDAYHQILAANESSADQAIMLINPSLGNEEAGDRQRYIREQVEQRSQRSLRQLWVTIGRILTKDQRQLFDHLRGPMPESARAELMKLETLSRKAHGRSVLPILKPQHTDMTPVALDVPSDAEVVAAWTALRKKNGQPAPSSTEVLNFRRVMEKITDYADPPQFYPMIGMARLHHADYKCSIYAPGKPVEVVYLDRTHLHQISSVNTEMGESEFQEHRVDVRVEKSDLDASTAWLRYHVRNLGSKPIAQLQLVVGLPAGIELAQGADNKKGESNQLTFAIEMLGPGRQRAFEVKATFNDDHPANQTVLVKSGQSSIAYGQVPVPSSDSEASTTR